MEKLDININKYKELKEPHTGIGFGVTSDSMGSGPDQVTGVAVTPDSTTELTVSWNAVTAIPAVSGYLVERSPNGTDSWTTVAASHGSTSFGDSGLSVYTVFYYRVSAINDISTGPSSAVANNRTLGTVPSQVTGLSASAASTSQINLSWSAASGTPSVDNYTVEWSSNNSSWNSLTTTASTSTSQTGIGTYTLRYYRVKANNSVGSGSYSSSASARTNGTTPTTPTLTLTDNDPDVGVSWTTSTGNPSVTYTLQHSLSSSFSSGVTTKASGGTGTTYTDSSVTTDVTHYYRVKGVNAYASGSYSSTANILIVGGLSGYIGCFGGDSVTIDYITIATPSNAVDFGDLSSGRQLLAGCHSSTRGVFSGGLSANVMDYITIVTTGNATDFGDMTVSRWNLTGLNSSTRGVFAGGFDGSGKSNVMDYITIASTGNASDFGDLTANKQQLAGCHSTTRGCFGGGTTGSNTNVIEYITIASTGNASDFGDLTTSRVCRGAVNSSAGRGCFGSLGTIDYITISSTGNATDFGDLSHSTDGVTGVHSDVRGVFADDFSGIDYITIASTGNATDFGDLSSLRNHGGVNN